MKKSIEFGVIGLGVFGLNLVKSLAAAGREVLVIDIDADKIKHIADQVDHAIVADTLDPNALKEAGIQNCDTVIVCIGEETEASILTTLNVIDLEVPNVIAKAISPEHGRVLIKIGANVVYPEKDMATRLANNLMSVHALEYIEISPHYSIVEIKLSHHFKPHSILEMSLRKKHKLNAIAIVKGEKVVVEINPDVLVEPGDMLVVVGHIDNIRKFQETYQS
jgi:trk system potassium uptake protein TrkA